MAKVVEEMRRPSATYGRRQLDPTRTLGLMIADVTATAGIPRALASYPSVPDQSLAANQAIA
jgi:hypothetical protein